jgi:hypothetical protein
MSRLKWLFLCEETAQQMRWQKEGIRDSEDIGIMFHPADAESWKALDHFDPEFARDPRSVRLGLSMKGFQPYNSNSIAYSCWLVFMMPYNLPPNKCLKEGFIFLDLVFLGPKKPKKQMNIFLCSLMEELKELWQGVDAYLWSIHDYLVYGKFADWCVHG